MGQWIKPLLNKWEDQSLDAWQKKPEGCDKLPIIPVLG